MTPATNSQLGFIREAAPRFNELDFFRNEFSQSFISETSYAGSRYYNNSSTQCQGTTLKGLRCKKRTKDPSGCCHYHR